MKVRVVLGSELAMFPPPAHLYSPKVSSFIGRASESTWVSSLSFTEDTQRGAGFFSLSLDTGPHPQVGDTGEALPLCALSAPSTVLAALRRQETFKGGSLTSHGPGCHLLWAPICPQHPMLSCQELRDHGGLVEGT